MNNVGPDDLLDLYFSNTEDSEDMTGDYTVATGTPAEGVFSLIPPAGSAYEVTEIQLYMKLAATIDIAKMGGGTALSIRSMTADIMRGGSSIKDLCPKGIANNSDLEMFMTRESNLSDTVMVGSLLTYVRYGYAPVLSSGSGDSIEISALNENMGASRFSVFQWRALGRIISE